MASKFQGHLYIIPIETLHHEFPYNTRYSYIGIENSIKRKNECRNHFLFLKVHSTSKSTGTLRSNMIKDFFIRKGDVWWKMSFSTRLIKGKNRILNYDVLRKNKKRLYTQIGLRYIKGGSPWKWHFCNPLCVLLFKNKHSDISH